MPGVVRRIAVGRGSLAARLCFLFTVFTVARGNESRLARWDELDLEERVWSLPGERTKTGNPHRQPLSAAALQILDYARSLRGAPELVFPSQQKDGDGPLSDVGMMHMIKRNGLGPKMTVHGCRATFKTWANECTGEDFEVKELSLGHLVPDPYSRGDQLERRRDIMEQWGVYCVGEQGDALRERRL